MLTKTSPCYEARSNLLFCIPISEQPNNYVLPKPLIYTTSMLFYIFMYVIQIYASTTQLKRNIMSTQKLTQVLATCLPTVYLHSLFTMLSFKAWKLIFSLKETQWFFNFYLFSTTKKTTTFISLSAILYAMVQIYITNFGVAKIEW